MFSTITFDVLTENSRKAPAGQPSRSPRPRRHQVVRACANCRAFRIKCDSKSPCENCRRKGKKCGGEGKAEVRTFAGAVREIERLNEHIQVLQQELNSKRACLSPSFRPRGSDGDLEGILPLHLDPRIEYGGNTTYTESLAVNNNGGAPKFYGPASAFHYLERIQDALTKTSSSQFKIPGQDPLCQRLFEVSNTNFESNFMYMAGPISRIYMERPYEEHYLNMFWDRYHCLYPVMEEREFWSYHRSLWDQSALFRKPSPLIDIMLAIALQHGSFTKQAHGKVMTLSDKTDEMIASRWFYRRCQMQLTNELESPSVATIRSYFLSIVYLANANSQNAAHSLLAMAIRSGVILGLHLEPSRSLPVQEREAHKRLWWLLYSMEMSFAMELGRPLAINISQVTCRLPSDECISYNTFDQTHVIGHEPSLQSYHVHHVRLVLTARAICVTFYEECARLLSSTRQRSLYEHLPSLERSARHLHLKLKYAEQWLHDLPEAFKPLNMAIRERYSRNGNRRTSFSVDERASDWFSLQKLFITLQYHHFMMSVQRPFVCFPPPCEEEDHIVNQIAHMCVEHARTSTIIINSALTETKLLNGHHEVFRWQWNALLVLVGHAIAYPGSSADSETIQSISHAISNFDLLSEHFPIALLASQTSRELLTRAVSFSGNSRTVTSRADEHQLDPRMMLSPHPSLSSPNLRHYMLEDSLALVQNGEIISDHTEVAAFHKIQDANDASVREFMSSPNSNTSTDFNQVLSLDNAIDFDMLPDEREVARFLESANTSDEAFAIGW